MRSSARPSSSPEQGIGGEIAVALEQFGVEFGQHVVQRQGIAAHRADLVEFGLAFGRHGGGRLLDCGMMGRSPEKGSDRAGGQLALPDGVVGAARRHGVADQVQVEAAGAIRLHLVEQPVARPGTDHQHNVVCGDRHLLAGVEVPAGGQAGRDADQFQVDPEVDAEGGAACRGSCPSRGCRRGRARAGRAAWRRSPHGRAGPALRPPPPPVGRPARRRAAPAAPATADRRARPDSRGRWGRRSRAPGGRSSSAAAAASSRGAAPPRRSRPPPPRTRRRADARRRPPSAGGSRHPSPPAGRPASRRCRSVPAGSPPGPHSATWPPSRCLASNSVTLWPRRAAVSAAAQTGGTAADHGDLLRHGSRRHVVLRQLPLRPGGGVVDAGDRRLGEDRAHAPVGADAGAHLRRPRPARPCAPSPGRRSAGAPCRRSRSRCRRGSPPPPPASRSAPRRPRAATPPA